MKLAPRPYHECTECGSAAVAVAAPGRPGPRLRCTRCGHAANSFPRADVDPAAFDNRPRDAGGRVVPIFYGQDQ